MAGGIDLRTVSFAEPLFLWLLLAPGVLTAVWLWRVVRRRGEARRYARERLPERSARFRPLGDLAFWIVLLASLSLCIVALARPQGRMSVMRRSSADFIVLQDGSASMYVKDVRPDRWQRSVKFLRTFADALSWKGDRVALALFAYSASPQIRLTRDPNALFFFLDHLGTQSPFLLEDDPTWDTNIGEAVYWGLKIVDKDQQIFGKSNRPKAFVIVSDGQEWSGDVASSIAAARARGIVVHVVGVGTVTGGLIPAPAAPVGPRLNAADAEGTGGSIRAILDRDSLRRIARAGGGEYFEIGSEPDRSIAVKIISSVRRSARADGVDQTFQDLYWPCLLGAAALLCAGVFALNTKSELLWETIGLLVGLLALATSLGR
jgi:Ca-activated chloride channel family protein